jgi:hypothetical protein
MNIVIDIETIPDQSAGAVELIAKDLEVKAPDMLKPKLIEALGLGDKGKFKTVPELKSMWVDKFGEAEKLNQANAKWLKTSFDGAYGQICCICITSEWGPERFFAVNEEELISDFWERIEVILNNRHPYFIAHNAKFDLPFLYHRSVINQSPVAKGFKPHGRHGQDYFCTMEAWAGFNGKIGLDRLAGILGEGSKTEGMSGAEVWPEYQKGNIDKIDNYCHDDVQLTKKIYNRLTFNTL